MYNKPLYWLALIPLKRLLTKFRLRLPHWLPFADGEDGEIKPAILRDAANTTMAI